MAKMDSSEMETVIAPKAGRILIVDDEEIVHLTLKRLLEPEGYSIDSSFGGQEALQRLETGYDLLVLDIRMPDMDGIEVLREIRKREIDIEVLILTGYATMESATQALNYGARGYLMKPIENIAEFRNRVREAVYIARLARGNRQFYDALVSGKADSLLIDGKVYQVPTLRQENKEIFQRLMEVIPQAVGLLDFDGNITFANVNFARMVCQSYQDLLGTRFESYIIEEDQNKVIEAFTRLSSGQLVVSIAAQLKTRFGSFLSVIISASPIHYRMEYRGIVAVISDTTEINTVRGKVELLANLVENAQYDMIFIVKPDGQIMECNFLARSSFSYSQSEMLSLNIRALFKFGVDERWEKIVDAIEQFSRWRGELIAISQDGTEFPVEITVSRPANKVDNSATMICFAQDIAERKQAQEALQKAYRELQESQVQLIQSEKMSAMGILVAGVAHEMNNPMMGILNFSQYCLKHTSEDDRRHPVLQDIQQETQRCIDIVQNLLKFSRIDREDEAYQKESCTVILERVLKLLSYRTGKQSITYHTADGTPEVWMEANGIQQVFLNLVSNALDALERREKKEIHVDICRDGEFVQATIGDTGGGIAPENVQKIFDPFFTTKPAGQGTGLGLSVSRAIIKGHGGEITCESEPGIGTKFRVLLPINRRKEGAK